MTKTKVEHRCQRLEKPFVLDEEEGKFLQGIAWKAYEAEKKLQDK